MRGWESERKRREEARLYRGKSKGGYSAGNDEDRPVCAMRTGSTSVPEVGRTGAKEAEPACGGPPRYSMVSVPSRHGSGLDVVLSSEGFFVRSCSSTITVLPVIYELKSRRDNVILISTHCYVSHRSINDPSNVIDGLTRRIYIYIYIFFKYAQFEIVWILRSTMWASMVFHLWRTEYVNVWCATIGREMKTEHVFALRWIEKKKKEKRN